MVSIMKTFEITVPQKDDVCCAICKIINNENDSLIYSNFCLNKLRCRQFLQETPQAMAAPVINRKILEAGGSMYIVVAKDFFQSCTFQEHCDALNVHIMDLLDPIPTYIYKACLLHTVEYKLAPQWNKVGLYLVEGRDFLSSTGSINAVTLNIGNIHGNYDTEMLVGNNAQLQIEAVKLKIPFVKLNTERPSQYDIQPPVRVLPSMKMANVLHISKTIKEKHFFKDYEHLRTYWKDMHGYMLPDYKEGLLFYDIQFFYFKSNIFLYPETCLASGPLQILAPPIDPVPLIYKFVRELRGSVSKLCGQQLDICPVNTYQAVSLASTPALPRIGKFPSCDTGYGTLSGRVNGTTSTFRIPDMCDIPMKRMRMSLSSDIENNDSLTCETESNNFDLGISSTSKFRHPENVSDISELLYGKIAVSKAITQKDKNKSHYFEKKDEQFQDVSFKELMDEEEKPEKLSLKEKLLKNISDK